MDFHDLTPAVERLWIDEIRHLHSLWRRGPPRQPNPSSATPTALRLSSLTPFKKEERRKQKKAEKLRRRVEKKKQQQEQQQSFADPGEQQHPPSDRPSNAEWPCKPPPEPQLNAAGWGDPIPNTASAAEAPPLSEEEQARLAWTKVQQKCVRTCKELFLEKNSSNDEDEVEDQDEEDDPMSGDGGGREAEYFGFFLGLFEKEGDLRSYYEKRWEKGEFWCLVCQAVGERLGKRFVDCVGLVLHANSISKTKRKGGHRAFGKAICRVLNWEIARLPSIVLGMGEPLGQTLATAAGRQEEGATNQNDDISKEDKLPVGNKEGDVMDCVDRIGISDTLTEDSPQEITCEHKGSPLEETQEPVNRNNEALVDHMETSEITDTTKVETYEKCIVEG